MLMFRKVYAIDTVSVVSEAFALKYVVLPLPYLQKVMWRNIDTKAISLAILPMPIIETTIITIILTISLSLSSSLLANVITRRINQSSCWKAKNRMRISLEVTQTLLHSSLSAEA